jgi:hypothetical protein
METRAKLEECYEILTAALRTGRTSRQGLLGRAHALLESALGDFFDDLEDVAALPDEETVYIGEFPPLPRA